MLTFQAPDSHAAWIESTSKWFDENMIDAEDGKLDIGNYLSSATGFLPVPIIITEPAVGFGAGVAVAVAYFHPPKESAPASPTITSIWAMDSSFARPAQSGSLRTRFSAPRLMVRRWTRS